NFGSFFASLFAPLLLRHFGPAVAFGVPGVLMFIATVLVWVGRRQYVNVPPSGKDPHSFLNVIRAAVRRRSAGQGNACAMGAWGGVAAAAVALLLWACDAAGVGVPWPDAFGFVITGCLALGVLIALGGWGAALQLERARGLHPDAA